MKLQDVKGTAINTSKIALINESSINREEGKLNLVMDGIKYVFNYDTPDKLVSDYQTLLLKLKVL